MIEEAEEEMKHRMFEDDDIGAYSFSRDRAGENSQMGDTTIIGGLGGDKQQVVVTADEKTAAMRTNYNDPFADTLENLKKSGNHQGSGL